MALRTEDRVDSPVAQHQPVLSSEAMGILEPSAGSVWVDATLGAGGFAERLLAAVGPSGRVLGIDRDPGAIARASRRLAPFTDRFVPILGNHLELVRLVREAGVFAVDGIVADLGVSSLQLDDPARGFSFRSDGPLDMRMDPRTGPTAADLLAELSEAELRRILRTFGEERLAGPIARAIVRQRARSPILRTSDLAGIVERVAGNRARRFRIHPATRTFQALRIVVNGEVEGLQSFVNDAVSLLRRGGRLVVISFHSLEDREIKRAMRSLAERCICPPGLPVCGCGRENVVRRITSRPVRPTREEIEKNPRSRSAKLRAVERL